MSVVTEKTTLSPWAHTVSGRRIDLLNPDPDQVVLTDIAHGLARHCRFAGQTRGPVWTVAHHLVAGDDVLQKSGASENFRLQWLVHDAHEFALGDITRPAALAVCDARALEAVKSALDAAIFTSIGMDAPAGSVADALKRHDDLMLEAERLRLMANDFGNWPRDPRFDDDGIEVAMRAVIEAHSHGAGDRIAGVWLARVTEILQQIEQRT